MGLFDLAAVLFTDRPALATNADFVYDILRPSVPLPARSEVTSCRRDGHVWVARYQPFLGNLPHAARYQIALTNPHALGRPAAAANQHRSKGANA